MARIGCWTGRIPRRRTGEGRVLSNPDASRERRNLPGQNWGNPTWSAAQRASPMMTSLSQLRPHPVMTARGSRPSWRVARGGRLGGDRHASTLHNPIRETNPLRQKQTQATTPRQMAIGRPARQPGPDLVAGMVRLGGRRPAAIPTRGELLPRQQVAVSGRQKNGSRGRSPVGKRPLNCDVFGRADRI
jgi:hypothetical protein